MRFVQTFCTVLASLLLFGCGSSAGSQDSSTKWAHTPSKKSMATMNSRIQYLDLKFKTDFDKIAVCVQGSESYSGSALLFETKLAYAAWLNASGQGSEKTWNYLDFELSSSCNMRDNSYSSVVVISEEANMTPDQEIDKTFSKNKVSCKRVGYSASCDTGSMTMGRGGSGGISYQYVKPETWDTLLNNSPATVLLSPFVQWTSMESELKNASLKGSYAALKAKAATVTYAELLSFNRLLESTLLKLPNDGRLDHFIKTFLDSKEVSLTQIYVPVQPGYHVLLHEVGHQFGMDHADNPSSQSETGSSPGASKDVSGQWSTDTSTMAYADEYLYLTADDKAGILDLATKSAAFVKAHRGL